jgi:hypothetical protein
VSGDRVRAPTPGPCLRAGEKKSKENSSFAPHGGGTNYKFLYKFTEASFFFFGLPSFPRKESFGGLPEFQSSLALLPVCLGFQFSDRKN